MFDEVDELLKKFVRGLQSAFEALGITSERIATLDAAAKLILNFPEFLGKQGWGIPAHTLAATPFTSALAESNGDLNKAEQFISDYYQSVAGGLVLVLAEQPVLKPWEDTLKAALRAHEREEYGVAIPVWLIAIEVVVRALRDRQDHPQTRKHKAFSNLPAKRYLPSFNALFYEREQSKVRDILGHTLSAMGQDDKHASKYGSTVNRNIVMHGIASVASRDDSLRVLSVLYALVDEAMYDENSAVGASKAF